MGEQIPVVVMLLYRRPSLASESKVGVGTGPPNVLDAPKPTSSVRITSTLGASAAGRTIWGQLVAEEALAGASEIAAASCACAAGTIVMPNRAAPSDPRERP